MRNETVSIGGSGFSAPSPGDNCEGSIDSSIDWILLINSQLSSDAVNKDGKNNSTPGIHGLNKNNEEINID